MPRIRLVATVALAALCATPAVLDAPAPRAEDRPLRVRPGHARAQLARAAPAPPVRLASSPADPDAAVLGADLQTPADEPARRPLGSGIASYYGAELAGNRTASGERFDPDALTAAHRTLPFGTRVEVTNARTGATVTVRINDRGPFHGGRIVDLSHEAARRIGIARAGTGRVELAVVEA